MNLVEQIKEKYFLEQYIEEQTGFSWKQIGSWKDLAECPICGGHQCFRLSPNGSVYCFQCYACCFDVIQFRALFEKVTWKESLERFKDDLGIKKWDKNDVDWCALRESAGEYLREILFTCPTKFQFRNNSLNPLHYLTDVRKHSIESILNFRIGFNDGSLIRHLESQFTKDSVKASGLGIIPEGCFVYPFIVNGDIKYFRIKDPNKIKKMQMPSSLRSKDCVWFNQDVIQEGKEIWCVEGEDDVVSLWDCGIDAVACCGTLTLQQINFLKIINLNVIYACFDGDPAGKRDEEVLTRNYDTNLFVIPISQGKDIDDLIRESENHDELIANLKAKAYLPTPESKNIIKQKQDGYYIVRYTHGSVKEIRLTNWTVILEAVIVRNEDERIRKCILKNNGYETTIFMPSEVFANTIKLKEFLYSVSNRLLYFMGNETDLTFLVQFLEVTFKPKIVLEYDCVGEIDVGFISDNVFIGNNGDYRPLINGYLDIGNGKSIKITELVKRGGSKSEIPYFNLTEPVGGIQSFKDHVFDLMIKNRNLKVAFILGWIKATLWAKWFYERKRFFPILMLHGKYAGGKTQMANWMMSILGLRDCTPEIISDRGTTEIGLSRKMAYYSSLPIFVDDYRNDESGQRFHTFFRGIFNRSSPTKGLKEDFGVRRVIVRGCLLLTGETSPTDPALLSRIVSVELTKQERNDKYYKELVKLEPFFNSIGLAWLKERNTKFDGFLNHFEALEAELMKEIDDPRQASIWAVAMAGALTENYFKKDDLFDFCFKLANLEIEQRKGEEILNSIWEALDILHKRDMLKNQVLYYDSYYNSLKLHLPGAISVINADMGTRHYKIPNQREIAKLLRQEPYIIGAEPSRVDGKLASRWVMDFLKSPEILQNMFKTEEMETENL